MKCLHAHVAHFLATGDDPVGRWTLDQIEHSTSGTTRDRSDLASDRRRTTNADVGGLTVMIGDASIEIAMTGGGRHVLPIGPATICAGEFERRDPPPPACLTNALGTVVDHLDDMLIESPAIAATPSILFVGHHAESLARVEIGSDAVPDLYLVDRGDLEDVFRTLVSESPDDRLANPGLDADHVGTIIATCCVVLAIMRRLALGEARFAARAVSITITRTGRGGELIMSLRHPSRPSTPLRLCGEAGDAAAARRPTTSGSGARYAGATTTG